jgi:hypothetical protein
MEHQYLVTKEQYLAVKAAWTKTESHDAWQNIIYNILRDKPADLGFIQKTHSIQGNDPWYAFNSAISRAKYCSKHQNFKDYFGIEQPEGFIDALNSIKK